MIYYKKKTIYFLRWRSGSGWQGHQNLVGGKPGMAMVLIYIIDGSSEHVALPRCVKENSSY